jgi:hypothetical protein
MNDDELNELIARSEEEAVLFRELDAKREREILESWRNGGHRGKPPAPLIQLEELPECYQTDEPFEAKELEIIEEGRGQRRRNVVSYNDGLDDDTWAMVCFISTCRYLVSVTYRDLGRHSRTEKTFKSCQSGPEKGRRGGQRTSY